MNLLDILDLDLIDLDMDATDKDGVLKQLSSMLYKKGNIKDLDKFLEAVYEKRKHWRNRSWRGLRFLMV